jgi:hypothetical protein
VANPELMVFQRFAAKDACLESGPVC